MKYRLALVVCLFAVAVRSASAQVVKLNPRYTSPNSIGTGGTPSTAYLAEGTGKGKLYLAWEFQGKLHIMVSSDLGGHFSDEHSFDASSLTGPFLVLPLRSMPGGYSWHGKEGEPTMTYL